MLYYSGQYRTFKTCVLKKGNETEKGLWEISAVLPPDWAFNIILYMTQYIAYTIYNYNDTEEGNVLHHH